ncbi:MAG: Maf family protein [Vicinamibacterales bacterium]
MRLILASASPRRADLLRSAGYDFETVTAEVDESPLAGETPEAYVARLATEKARAALRMLDRLGRGSGPGGPLEPPHAPVVLAADTTVVVDGLILGKPASEDDAVGMLRRLSGRPHVVLTGVALVQGSAWTLDVASTTVWMAPVSERDIRWYVATGEPFGKAGAYAIQGLASRFVERVDGSYSNVVGLPVALVHRRLLELAAESAQPRR